MNTTTTALLVVDVVVAVDDVRSRGVYKRVRIHICLVSLLHRRGERSWNTVESASPLVLYLEEWWV